MLNVYAYYFAPAVDILSMDRWGMQEDLAELLQGSSGGRKIDRLWTGAAGADRWESKNKSIVGGWHIHNDNVQNQGKTQNRGTI